MKNSNESKRPPSVLINTWIKVLVNPDLTDAQKSQAGELLSSTGLFKTMADIKNYMAENNINIPQ